MKWTMDGEKHLNSNQDNYRIGLKTKKLFIKLINTLREAGFVIIWIDKRTFSSSALPLYS